MVEPKIGEVWDVDFSSTVGREQSGFRPALVISNDTFNELPNGLHIVVPITSRNRGVRIHIPIEPPEGGIKTPSVLMCDQVRSQSVLRFYKKRGAVSPDLLRLVQLTIGTLVDR